MNLSTSFVGHESLSIDVNVNVDIQALVWEGGEVQADARALCNLGGGPGEAPTVGGFNVVYSRPRCVEDLRFRQPQRF